jgi:hypothetical protein
MANTGNENGNTADAQIEAEFVDSFEEENDNNHNHNQNRNRNSEKVSNNNEVNDDDANNNSIASVNVNVNKRRELISTEILLRTKMDNTLKLEYAFFVTLLQMSASCLPIIADQVYQKMQQNTLCLVKVCFVFCFVNFFGNKYNKLL